MKNAVLAVSFLTALVGGAAVASADHLPPGAGTNWTGPYIAASVGYGVADIDYAHRLGADVFNSDISADSVTGTIALGYDRQLQSGIVVGIFGDYTFGELEGSGARFYPLDPVRGREAFNHEFDNVWAIGARVGLVRNDHTLWYLAAGYTEADFTFSDQYGSIDRDLQGYFLGAGVEHNIRDNFFLKFEYRFSDFGDDTYFSQFSACCGLETEEIDTEIHSIRLGVAYKFGSREAVAAPLK